MRAASQREEEKNGPYHPATDHSAKLISLLMTYGISLWHGGTARRAPTASQATTRWFPLHCNLR